MTSRSESQLQELLNAAREIGSVLDCNGHYQHSLAAHLGQTGTPLRDLTVGQLVDAIQAHADAYNDLHARIYGGLT